MTFKGVVIAMTVFLSVVIAYEGIVWAFTLHQLFT